MKLTFRDLKQQKFVVEAEPSETVGQVKEKISEEKGWDVAQQKLIYSGKILQDANTIESYNIEEKGFIVCMVSKPKAAPSTSAAASSKAPSTPAPATASTPAAPAPPAAPSAATANTEAPSTPSPASGAPGGPAFGDPSALAMGTQGEGVISQMEAMGFERPAIERAMRAAFFNPDRAIDYLLNGIPEHAEQEQRRREAAGQQEGAPTETPAGAPAAAAAPAPTPATAPSNPPAPSTESDEPVNLFEAAAAQAGGGQGGAGAGGAARGARGVGQGLAGATPSEGAAGGMSNLEFLRNNPHFQQLRQLVQQQPQMLEPILQQVGAGNPQLAQLIGQNQEQFLQLLSEDIEDDSQVPPGTQTISVTEEERDAIERLCRLGFSRDSVIQAYFACDKNEELAANFLFDQPDDNDNND